MAAASVGVIMGQEPGRTQEVAYMTLGPPTGQPWLRECFFHFEDKEEHLTEGLPGLTVVMRCIQFWVSRLSVINQDLSSE